MRSLWSGFSFHPPAISSPANQSSSSGCVGRSPWAPKSFGVRTNPSPKWCCHSRLTITRASSRPAPPSTSVIHSANAVRWNVVAVPAGRRTFTASSFDSTDRKPSVTSGPCRAASPRKSRYDFSGSGRRVGDGQPFRRRLRLVAFHAIFVVFLNLVVVFLDGSARGEVALFALGGGEGGQHPVVVARRDRVELVVVAAGAADRQTEHRGPGRGQHVVQLVVAVLGALQRRALAGVGEDDDRPRRQEAGRRQRGRVVGPVLVAGQLPFDERVEGKIVVEGVDHEIAVEVRIRTIPIRFVAVAVGVAHGVEPVSAPALAVMRVGQEAVDQLLVGVPGPGRRRTPRFLPASAAGRAGRKSPAG